MSLLSDKNICKNMTIENIKTLKELYKELYDILNKADIGDIIELDLRYESDAVSVTYEYDMWSYGSYGIKTYLIPFEVITDVESVRAFIKEDDKKKNNE